MNIFADLYSLILFALTADKKLQNSQNMGKRGISAFENDNIPLSFFDTDIMPP